MIRTIFFLLIIAFTNNIEAQKPLLKEYGSYFTYSDVSTPNQLHLMSKELQDKFEYVEDITKDSSWFVLPHNIVKSKTLLSLESTRFYEIGIENNQHKRFIGVMSFNKEAVGSKEDWAVFFLFRIDPKTHVLLKVRHATLKGYNTANFKYLFSAMGEK